MSTAATTATPTFVHAGVFVLNHSKLVDFAKLLENGLEVLLFQIPGNLPHKQLDGVGLLHQDRVERATGYCRGWGTNGSGAGISGEGVTDAGPVFGSHWQTGGNKKETERKTKRPWSQKTLRTKGTTLRECNLPSTLHGGHALNCESVTTNLTQFTSRQHLSKRRELSYYNII